MRSILFSLEVDTRLLGMVVALAIIWVGFDVMSGGGFLTTRNLWNLSVQSSSIAVMATGMVLIIVSRNIDLSVGSILGLTGYVMAMLQAVWIPTSLGLGFDQPYTWILALAIGIALGAAIGGFQGFIIAYGGVPAFIVTLGGLLVWRGLVFEIQQGQTISPLDKTFALLGGGPTGSIGDVASWVVAIVACVGIVYTLIASRRRRRRYGFQLRAMWAEVTVGVSGVVPPRSRPPSSSTSSRSSRPCGWPPTISGPRRSPCKSSGPTRGRTSRWGSPTPCSSCSGSRSSSRSSRRADASDGTSTRSVATRTPPSSPESTRAAR